HSNNKKSTIVDIGTGSGCIAITLAKHLPQAQVYAIDISKEALAVTKQNAIHHSVEIQCIEADMCNIDTYSKIPTCTTIVSNPPYICSNEKKYMNLNVLEHEPHTALFVPDNNPLQYYKALANIGLQKLETNGMLICEINEAYGIETKELFEQFGFVNCSIILDLHNKDRFLQAYKL
ncbi:MAG TPA: HemK/PrmC family methyltransferase, partial [Bacteroidales bacterium]|nr:HemK/PrmC family methyltransferase [Bacteroidales bacterium]